MPAVENFAIGRPIIICISLKIATRLSFVNFKGRFLYVSDVQISNLFCSPSFLKIFLHINYFTFIFLHIDFFRSIFPDYFFRLIFVLIRLIFGSRFQSPMFPYWNFPDVTPLQVKSDSVFAVVVDAALI